MPIIIDPVTLRALFAEGIPYHEIAARLGVSRSGLMRALRAEGLSRPRGPRKGSGGRVPTLTRAVLLEARQKHDTKAAAARALGVTSCGLRVAILREGVDW